MTERRRKQVEIAIVIAMAVVGLLALVVFTIPARYLPSYLPRVAESPEVHYPLPPILQERPVTAPHIPLLVAKDMREPCKPAKHHAKPHARRKPAVHKAKRHSHHQRRKVRKHVDRKTAPKAEAC